MDEDFTEREAARFRQRFLEVYTDDERQALTQTAKHMLTEKPREWDGDMRAYLEALADGRFTEIPQRRSHAEQEEEADRLPAWSTGPGGGDSA